MDRKLRVPGASRDRVDGTLIEKHMRRARTVSGDGDPRTRDASGRDVTGLVTILVADDEPSSREALRCLLEDRGYRVLEAPNGGDAIRLVREWMPDAVIMDLRMPVVDGWEAAESLRSYVGTRHVPIIAITGGAIEAEQERIRAVCNELLLKPCVPSRLQEALDRVIGSGRN
jgi:CheY-like chemotaxis protein